MNASLRTLLWLIFSPIAKLISSLSGRAKPRHGGSIQELDEDLCSCSRCVAIRCKHFEGKCALIENYIAGNLVLYEQLEQILQLQTLNIAKQVDLLRDLDSSSEHLQVAVGDCLEKHVSFVNQFTQGMERLQINQKIEESVAIGRFEENTEDFKRSLMGNIVNNERSSITQLLQ